MKSEPKNTPGREGMKSDDSKKELRPGEVRLSPTKADLPQPPEEGKFGFGTLFAIVFIFFWADFSSKSAEARDLQVVRPLRLRKESGPICPKRLR